MLLAAHHDGHSLRAVVEVHSGVSSLVIRIPNISIADVISLLKLAKRLPAFR